MIKEFLKKRITNLALAALFISFSSFLSALLGLVRDRLLASRFGASADLDVYFAAFKIPDLIYAIIFAGGIGAIFVPLFSQKYQKNDREAWIFTNQILTLVFLVAFTFCILGFLFAPLLAKIVAPGFSLAQEKKLVALMRIMYLSPLFLGLSSIFSGILQFFERFFVYGLAPLLYNLGIIIGIIFLSPFFGIIGLAFGVVLGAFLHFLFQLLVVSSFFKPQVYFSFDKEEIKKIIKITIPSAIGSLVPVLNLLVITSLASTLEKGTIAIFNFSNNLRLLPVGLIGLSFATSFYARFSRLNNYKAKLRETINGVIKQVLYLIIPISVLFFLLRAQIIRIILGTGAFGWQETRLTAGCLGVFSLFIFAPALISVFEKAFFALKDTNTPMKMRIISFVFNSLFCFAFLFVLKEENFFYQFLVNLLDLKNGFSPRVIIFPLALSFSSLFNLFGLGYSLKKRLGATLFEGFLSFFKKIIFASLISGGIVYLSLQGLAMIFSFTFFWEVFLQAGLVFIIGILVFWAITYSLGVQEARIFSYLLRKNEKYS